MPGSNRHGVSSHWAGEPLPIRPRICGSKRPALQKVPENSQTLLIPGVAAAHGARSPHSSEPVASKGTVCARPPAADTDSRSPQIYLTCKIPQRPQMSPDRHHVSGGAETSVSAEGAGQVLARCSQHSLFQNDASSEFFSRWSETKYSAVCAQ